MSPVVVYFIVAVFAWPKAYRAIQRYVTDGKPDPYWDACDSCICSYAATVIALAWPAYLFVVYVATRLVNRKWFQPPDR